MLFGVDWKGPPENVCSSPSIAEGLEWIAYYFTKKKPELKLLEQAHKMAGNCGIISASFIPDFYG